MKKTSALATLLMAAVTSYAQQDNQEAPARNTDITTTTESVIEESVDWGNGESDGRSRLGMSGTRLPGKTKVVRSTTEITQVIDVKQRPADIQCESEIDLEYYQRDTETEVRTLFTADNCSSFDATYQLQIMYFNAAGEYKRLVVDEHWPEGRDEPHRKTYALEPDSELKRVSSRILSCTCNPGQ